MPLQVSRVLHAGYIFNFEGTRIIFDPIFENPFSRNCYAFPDVQFDAELLQREKFSAVFISHFHDDHCSLDSLKLLDRATPIYMFCIFPEMFQILRELGFANVSALVLDTSVSVGGFEITPRRALDADVDSIFQIKCDGLNILNVVDSWIDYDMLDLLVKQGPWDLILWPFQTMRELEVLSPETSEPSDRKVPPELLAQLQKLNPRHLIPSSCQFQMEPWSWYNQAFFPISYAGFSIQVRAVLPTCEIFRLDPGQSVEFKNSKKHKASAIPWIQSVGNQNVDYAYDPQGKPQSTKEIATRFPALTAEQTARVEKFCNEELAKKFMRLHQASDDGTNEEFESEAFFSKERAWELSTFDHFGTAEKWHYRISGGKAELVQRNVGSAATPLEYEAAWKTEVPIQRLWSALEEGEALTSMYVRVFPASGYEILEDPLIQTLFTGVFGSYQKFQLKKILADK